LIYCLRIYYREVIIYGSKNITEEIQTMMMPTGEPKQDSTQSIIIICAHHQFIDMKAYSIIIILFCIIANSFAQRPLSVERENHGCWTSADRMINWHVDSLNFWSSRGGLPEFLFDESFDWGRQIVRCFKEPELISFRKVIFDRVVNEKALRAIIKSKDKRLDELYNPEKWRQEMDKREPSMYVPSFPDLPYMKYSTRQLAERRLKELRDIKKRFGQ